MNIYIANRNRKEKGLRKEYKNALILDITSKATDDYKLLSPFYPHGDIPIPFSEGMTANSVESIWQGLKVFENKDIERNLFNKTEMFGIKRTSFQNGKIIGHRKGVYGKEILDYIDARFLIYLPTYKWVLDNIPKVHSIVETIKKKSEKQDIVLLDYNTNTNLIDPKKPISHAGLVKLYIEGNYPTDRESYTLSKEKQLELDFTKK